MGQSSAGVAASGLVIGAGCVGRAGPRDGVGALPQTLTSLHPRRRHGVNEVGARVCR